MNTTTAALEAHVTVATIRTWCRRNVIAAVKQAGRWIIDTASLAHRIAIDAMRSPRKDTRMLDLNSTTIKRRTVRRTGANIVSISDYAPLLADKLSDIADDGDRAHAVNVLLPTVIVISDIADADWDGDLQARDNGRLRTSYRGGIPQITVADVLDLAEQIRTQLATA